MMELVNIPFRFVYTLRLVFWVPLLHTVYLMSVNGQGMQGSDESPGRWQDYTHTQHRQRG